MRPLKGVARPVKGLIRALRGFITSFVLTRSARRTESASRTESGESDRVGRLATSGNHQRANANKPLDMLDCAPLQIIFIESSIEIHIYNTTKQHYI